MNNIEKNFERGFKEKLPNEVPEISFHPFFLAHRTPNGLEGLEKAFEKADIYIPEAFFWRLKELEIYKSVSQGEMTPKEAGQKIKFTVKAQRDLEIIYNSKKPILLADIPFSVSEKKEKLKVLVGLGAVHTRIYQELKKESKESRQFRVSREFSQLPIVFAFGEEMLRKIFWATMN